jgi:hypothetical protein
MQNCRASPSPANENDEKALSNPCDNLQRRTRSRPSFSLFARQFFSNDPERVDMKRYSFLLGIIVATVVCSSLLAQEKEAIQPNATVVSILQNNAGKAVELHLRSGEKIGGKVGQVTENIVYLSHLTGAEFYDAFVDVKDVTAVVIRVPGR